MVIRCHQFPTEQRLDVYLHHFADDVMLDVRHDLGSGDARAAWMWLSRAAAKRLAKALLKYATLPKKRGAK